MGRWVWHKVMPEELAKFITRDSVRWIVLPVDREAVLQGPGGRRALTEVIYDALAAQGVRYAPERYNPSDAVQEIRQPAEVLDQPREGTCLDLASLFCGVCEGYELLPMLIVLKTHALAAVALNHGLRDWDAYDRAEQQLFETGVLRDSAELLKLLHDGSYVAVECTGFTRKPQAKQPTGPVPPRMTFEEATTAGMQRLGRGEEFQFAVDVAVARWRWKIDSEATSLAQAVAAGQPLDVRELTRLMNEMGNRRAIDRFLSVAGTKMGASDEDFRSIASAPPPDAIAKQVEALTDARRAMAELGAAVTADSELQLGRLAALKRDYDAAEGHLRAAVELEPRSSAALGSYLRLAQSRTIFDVRFGNRSSANRRIRDVERVTQRIVVKDPVIAGVRGCIRRDLTRAMNAFDLRKRTKHLNRAFGDFESLLTVTTVDSAVPIGGFKFEGFHSEPRLQRFDSGPKLQGFEPRPGIAGLESRPRFAGFAARPRFHGFDSPRKTSGDNPGGWSKQPSIRRALRGFAAARHGGKAPLDSK